MLAGALLREQMHNTATCMQMRGGLAPPPGFPPRINARPKTKGVFPLSPPAKHILSRRASAWFVWGAAAAMAQLTTCRAPFTSSSALCGQRLTVRSPTAPAAARTAVQVSARTLEKGEGACLPLRLRLGSSPPLMCTLSAFRYLVVQAWEFMAPRRG